MKLAGWTVEYWVLLLVDQWADEKDASMAVTRGVWKVERMADQLAVLKELKKAAKMAA